ISAAGELVEVVVTVGHVAKERLDARPVAHNVEPRHRHAPARRLALPGEDAQRTALAPPIGPQEPEQLPAAQREVEPLHSDEGAVADGQIVEANDGVGHGASIAHAARVARVAEFARIPIRSDRNSCEFRYADSRLFWHGLPTVP